MPTAFSTNSPMSNRSAAAPTPSDSGPRYRELGIDPRLVYAPRHPVSTGSVEKLDSHTTHKPPVAPLFGPDGGQISVDAAIVVAQRAGSSIIGTWPTRGSKTKVAPGMRSRAVTP